MLCFQPNLRVNLGKRSSRIGRLPLLEIRRCRPTAYHLQILGAGEVRLELRLFRHLAQALPTSDPVALDGLAAKQSQFFGHHRLPLYRIPSDIIMSRGLQHPSAGRSYLGNG
ncbi:hypothetical protein SBA6_80038 [Candidatus Sulfopaludibacter sp. SbA6]|nr:hypothetical protein SBA6_80038 [Candidatus Sulfopaludibacter sp. SbA6]